jgi:hypothetical protein
MHNASLVGNTGRKSFVGQVRKRHCLAETPLLLGVMQGDLSRG